MGCGGPPQHNGLGTVDLYVGGMLRVTNVGLEPVGELTGFGCMKSDIT